MGREVGGHSAASPRAGLRVSGSSSSPECWVQAGNDESLLRAYASMPWPGSVKATFGDGDIFWTIRRDAADCGVKIDLRVRRSRGQKKRFGEEHYRKRGAGGGATGHKLTMTGRPHDVREWVSLLLEAAENHGTDTKAREGLGQEREGGRLGGKRSGWP